LRFGDQRAMALMQALCRFALLPHGFSNATLRAGHPWRERQRAMHRVSAPLLGMDPSPYSPGRMTYDLRRLRLHGLIRRLPRRHRYEVTRDGLRVALFYVKAWTRLFRTGLAVTAPKAPPAPAGLQQAWRCLDKALERHTQLARLAA
jgi:hypothetical protein